MHPRYFSFISRQIWQVDPFLRECGFVLPKHLVHNFRRLKMSPPAGESNGNSECSESKIPRLDNGQHNLGTADGNVILKFAKLTDNAFVPTRGSKEAAGFDLYSAYDYVIPPSDKVLAKTDIQIAVPLGCYGRVAPRSGLAHKHFIDVGAGVIDQDYRGNVGVILFNFSKEEFKVNKGDRIAQLILERIFIPKLEECQSLDDTDRGSGGFGSTGAN